MGTPASILHRLCRRDACGQQNLCRMIGASLNKIVPSAISWKRLRPRSRVCGPGGSSPLLAHMFAEARIPTMAIDIPQPGAVYYGVDNYRAGLMAGRIRVIIPKIVEIAGRRRLTRIR